MAWQSSFSETERQKCALMKGGCATRKCSSVKGDMSFMERLCNNNNTKNCILLKAAVPWVAKDVVERWSRHGRVNITERKLCSVRELRLSM